MNSLSFYLIVLALITIIIIVLAVIGFWSRFKKDVVLKSRSFREVLRICAIIAKRNAIIDVAERTNDRFLFGTYADDIAAYNNLTDAQRAISLAHPLIMEQMTKEAANYI